MALEIFASIKAAGTDLVGDATETLGGVDVSNHFRIYEFENEVSLGGEGASGRATNRRQYKPITVRMPVQASAPEIFKACAENQPIEAVFKWFRPNVDSGQTEHFYTITLEQGRVCLAKQYLPDTSDPQEQTLPPMMEVGFTFQTIRWAHEVSSKEAEDNWQSGQS
ncbi:MAG: type VI secretion system tube protein TssD [Myxococcota bacterium]